MSLRYKLQYLIGLKPWEDLPEMVAGGQARALLDEEQEARESLGRALDLGCGSGIWSVELARRGWEVTAVDLVPKALQAARRRARKAGVDVRFVESSITELDRADLGGEFDLILDFGVVHGLRPEECREVGRQVSALAADGATLLMYAMAPGWRGPLPRGIDRKEIEAAYPEWEVTHDELFDPSDAPAAMKGARWYRLRHVRTASMEAPPSERHEVRPAGDRGGLGAPSPG